MRPPVAGFLVGLAAGVASFWLAYRAARPALLRAAQREIPGAIRRGVAPAVNGVIDAAGGDRLLEVLAAAAVEVARRELP